MNKNSIILIIQARMQSTRFPNKAIADLCGAPLIERVFQRIKRVKGIDGIILATTKSKEDDILDKIANSNKIEVFRGSENDVIDRFYKAAKVKNVNHIIRMCADNPIPEPSEYERLIKYHLDSNNDFSSNTQDFLGNGYPNGIGTEIFTFKSLEKIWKREKRETFREHISLNYFDYTKQEVNPKFNFKIGTINCPKEMSRPGLKLDVNYHEQYLFIKEIYENLFTKNKEFTVKEVIEWYDKKQSKDQKKL